MRILYGIQQSFGLEARRPDLRQALGTVVEVLKLDREARRFMKNLRHKVSNAQRSIGDLVAIQDSLAVLERVPIARASVRSKAGQLIHRNAYHH